MAKERKRTHQDGAGRVLTKWPLSSLLGKNQVSNYQYKNALNHAKEIQAKSQNPISERHDQVERQGIPVA
jgi:hypothetical protein